MTWLAEDEEVATKVGFWTTALPVAVVDAPDDVEIVPLWLNAIGFWCKTADIEVECDIDTGGIITDEMTGAIDPITPGIITSALVKLKRYVNWRYVGLYVCICLPWKCLRLWVMFQSFNTCRDQKKYWKYWYLVHYSGVTFDSREFSIRNVFSDINGLKNILFIYLLSSYYEG